MTKENINQKLEEAIKDFAASPSLVTERAIYESMSTASFLLPIIVADAQAENGQAIAINPGDKINVAQLTNKSGKKIYPAFTNIEEVRKWNKDLTKGNVRLIQLGVEGFEKLIEQNPEVESFAINPFTHNIIIGDVQLKKYHEIKEGKASKASLISAYETFRKEPNEDTERVVLKELEGTVFLMPVIINNLDDIIATDGNIARVKPSAAMSVVPLENKNGDRLYPAFTNEQEILKLKLDFSEPKHKLVRVTIKGYEKMLEVDESVLGFTVDPFTSNLVITRKLIDKYHDILNEEYVLHKTNQEDQAIMDALNVELAEHESVSSAYLLRKVYPEKMSYLVIVEKERDGKSIFADLKRAAMEVDRREDILEYLSYNDESAKKATENIEPFYVKGTNKKGLFGLFGKK